MRALPTWTVATTKPALAVRKTVAEAAAIHRMSRRIAHELIERHASLGPFGLIGIRTGGQVWAEELADELRAATGTRPPVGSLDIAMYRDDVAQRLVPEVGPTEIDFPIAGARLVLVDDVLYTGRTVRAALDALIDFGRPRRVQLAVLVDRGHRELPIQADYVGITVETTLDEDVRAELVGSDADRIVVRGRA